SVLPNVQPSDTTVGRLAREHLVTQSRGATVDTGPGWRFVIPHGEEAAIVGDREVGLPLSLGVGVGIQLDGCGECGAGVGRTDVEDVGWIAVAGIPPVIDVVHGAVLYRLLT